MKTMREIIIHIFTANLTLHSISRIDIFNIEVFDLARRVFFLFKLYVIQCR